MAEPGAAAGRLRLYVVTQDEPLYAPRYLAAIRRALVGRHDLVGVTALDPAGGLGWWGLVRQRWAMYGPVDFARAGTRFAVARLQGLLRGAAGARRSVRRFADRHGIPLVDTADVNDPGYVARVRAAAPDLLVSVAANQVFRAPLLAVPTRAAVNLHSSLLPRYRGLDGLFWALADGETEVGVTLHEMTAALDAGGIVAQRALPAPPEATLHDMYLAAIEAGAALLAEAADAYAAGAVTLAANDPAAGSYHSWPTREAARRFRQRGRRFF